MRSLLPWVAIPLAIGCYGVLALTWWSAIAHHGLQEALAMSFRHWPDAVFSLVCIVAGAALLWAGIASLKRP
jgi:hypothetical protein